ncbi:MAG TPA: type II secretion system F family protein, partial [Bacteroidales bacterium]|nr:type II secretion system F family protein [Bacteroidales bacterium]
MIKKLMTRKTRFNSEKFFYEKGEYLKNGISLTEALLISDDATDLDLRDKIMAGQKLHEAMGAANAFKRRELSLIRLAEETGDISGTFHAISLTLKDERELNEKIMTVLLYPMLLMGAAMVFLIASVYYIVPPLHTMLAGLGTENRVLSFIFDFSQQIPVTVMGFILTLMLMSLVRQLRNKEKLFRLVLGWKMERYKEMSFINELSLLTQGGLDILECLNLLQKEGHQCQA